MDFYIKNPPQNLMSIGFSNDGHGGHAAQHHEEMQTIANAAISKALEEYSRTLEEAIPRIIQEYAAISWAQAVSQLDSALNFDIKSSVQLGFDGLKEIFYGEKCQKYISDGAIKALSAELAKVRNFNFSI